MSSHQPAFLIALPSALLLSAAACGYLPSAHPAERPKESFFVSDQTPADVAACAANSWLKLKNGEVRIVPMDDNGYAVIQSWPKEARSPSLLFTLSVMEAPEGSAALLHWEGDQPYAAEVEAATELCMDRPAVSRA